jgi:ABC-2 type transport system ATP-binding protein
VNQDVLRETIYGAQREGRTVILSTHNMDQAEQLCDAVCIIARGEKVLDGTLEDVRRAHVSNRYAVRFEPDSPTVEAILRTSDGPFWNAVRAFQRWEFELTPGRSVQEALAALNVPDARIVEFTRIEPSLHEIFVQRVGDAATVTRQQQVRS